MVFLMETKIDRKRIEKVRRRCGFPNGIDIYAKGTRGGLSLAWKEEFKVTLRSFSKNHIDVMVKEENTDAEWRFTRFYGSPYDSNKNDSWNLLQKLGEDKTHPWLVCGDFNEIIYSFEKSGGIPREERKMEAFREALEECQLENIGYSGVWFTWERGNFAETNLRERLDRGVANEKWKLIFPTGNIHHLPHSMSDHCPLFINTKSERTFVRNPQFKFEAWWTTEKSLEERIKNIMGINYRFQGEIGHCIDTVQSAFVPGRLVSDNVLLAYAMLHTFRKKCMGMKGFMAVKLDMSKAYDRVEWGFIKEVMLKLGFEKKWRLSALMRMALKEGLLKGVKASRSGPAITHLLFTDYCILFGEATRKGASLLKGILKEYGNCSGQCVNSNKSTIFFSSNTAEGNREEVLAILRVRSSTDMEKYLGLPSMDITEKILRIPLAKEPHEDMIAWSGEPSREFTCRLFCCALWTILGERNRGIHERASRSAEETTHFIRNYILELNETEEATTKVQSEVRRWKTPTEQFVKINFDAAYDNNLCRAVVGIVARDGKGSVLLLYSTIQEKVAYTFAAEAIACSIAVQIGVDMQWRKIIIEGDALTSSAHFGYGNLKKKNEFYLIGDVPEFAMNLKEKEVRENQIDSGNEEGDMRLG
ncbi:reverse transcriptase [Gossypium australe]|uniref:Reverse transcriptase n=1 Tax=Gossypium australe TaxID=47621 RepID=A0A5B6WH31_9ROSI|nr:reverse transcriptase [Gossypium australe]